MYFAINVTGGRAQIALGVGASGYEIHHGRITRGGGEEFLGGAA